MRSRLASVVHTHCRSRGSDTVWAWFSNRVRSSAPKLGPRRGTCHCRWSRVGASSWGSENGPGWVGLTASQVQALATCAVRPAAPPHVSHPQFPPNHRATPSQAHLLPHIPVPLCTADFGEEPPDWRQGRAPHGGADGLLHADTPQCPSGDEQGVARPARALWCEHNRQHCGAVTEASMVCTPLVCGAHACVPHHAHALLRVLRVRAPACSNLGGGPPCLGDLAAEPVACCGGGLVRLIMATCFGNSGRGTGRGVWGVCPGTNGGESFGFGQVRYGRWPVRQPCAGSRALRLVPAYVRAPAGGVCLVCDSRPSV